MDNDAPTSRPLGWAAPISWVFALVAAALFIGKVFYAWPIDAVGVALFLVIWVPAVLPLLRRLKYKDFEVEFIERTVKQVQAEVATIANQQEIQREERKLNIKVDPYKIRLRFTSERQDARYFRVRVWLDAPADFLAQVAKVVFERHPTFKSRFKEVTAPPFEDSFRCWGEFAIRAEITLKSGETLRRQRYLALENGRSEVGEDPEPGNKGSGG